MNILEACTIDTPFGYVGECSKFTIDDVLTPFTLHNVMSNGSQYTIGLWVKTETEEPEVIAETTNDDEEEFEEEIDTGMSLLIRGADMPVTNRWVYHSHSFPTYGSDLKIYFTKVGTYYIYHPQLERGMVATDWAESPLDTEQKITDATKTANAAKAGVEELYIKLDESIRMVVSAINNGTLLEQTENGWVFAGGGTTDQLLELSNKLSKLDTSTSDSINQLKQDIAANDKLASYVKIDETGPEPVIKMGTYITDTETGESAFGKFSLQITPTAIEFWEEGLIDPIAYISNQQLYIEKAVIKQELAVGGFVLKQHGSRNNVGFLWKGGLVTPPTVEFTVDGTAYSVELGTTWHDWANANGWNCSSNEDGVWDSDYNYHIVNSSGTGVNGGDTIIAGIYSLST